MLRGEERRYVESARVGRLATADQAGRPHVVPVCFALIDERIATPIDEKPKRVTPERLRRSRDVAGNPRVGLLVDHYAEDWSALGWVQVRGRATRVPATQECHAEATAALREKYDQYAEHDLESRPFIEIEPSSVRSWGQLQRPAESATD
jgi:PPOX class probable F420-dependent enzyme